LIKIFRVWRNEKILIKNQVFYAVRKLANGEIPRIIAKTLFQVKTFEDPPMELRNAECGLKCKNPKSEIKRADAFSVQSAYGGLPGRAIPKFNRAEPYLNAAIKEDITPTLPSPLRRLCHNPDLSLRATEGSVAISLTSNSY